MQFRWSKRRYRSGCPVELLAGMGFRLAVPSYLIAEVLRSSTTTDLRASVELAAAPADYGVLAWFRY